MTFSIGQQIKIYVDKALVGTNSVTFTSTITKYKNLPTKSKPQLFQTIKLNRHKFHKLGMMIDNKIVYRKFLPIEVILYHCPICDNKLYFTPKQKAWAVNKIYDKFSCENQANHTFELSLFDDEYWFIYGMKNHRYFICQKYVRKDDVPMTCTIDPNGLNYGTQERIALDFMPALSEMKEIQKLFECLDRLETKQIGGYYDALITRTFKKIEPVSRDKFYSTFTQLAEGSLFV